MRYKNTKKRKTSKRKTSKRKTSRMKYGGEETTKCCMCGKNVNFKNSLVPRACLVKNGRKAHRICQECWWDETHGFARERANHNCPGCRNSIPLTKVKKVQYVEEVIDLTEDD